MRVVAGSAKGRRIVAPAGRDTRPTSDRVREAVFNALVSLGTVDGATALDLFAGSGALGIEALSRGAAYATFVERDRAALASIRANLSATGLADRAAVVERDALAYVAAQRAHVDIAFLDPPYAFDGWDALLEALPADLAVIESDRPVDGGEGWELVRHRRYGTTVVSIIRRRTQHIEESIV
ncbi:MAG: 16S rRNA (guanine(966)-N(2))-methyltransferase RsmD [Chloroflexi bacterium]|nr:16S rRNA (guanine(966)-N(2))-methyltransferase RsmD [Chloroflexota bacterium]MCI0637160.1 16S rRNA (guanine(966)-N(2))-methyltransferase RsmD [Actinomycetota bacterium]